MQLLIILALLLYGGSAQGAKGILEEVKPMLESLGDASLGEALKSAEQISEVLSAVSSFAPPKSFQNSAPAENPEQPPAIAFPLDPVSKIADRDITYSLSQYLNC